MSARINAENHPLFDQVQAALKEVTAQAAAREAAISEQSLASSESWAAWQSRGLQESQRLAECLDSIRAAKLRADTQVADADAELQRVERALQGWMEQARGMKFVVPPSGGGATA